MDYPQHVYCRRKGHVLESGDLYNFYGSLVCMPCLLELCSTSGVEERFFKKAEKRSYDSYKLKDKKDDECCENNEAHRCKVDAARRLRLSEDNSTTVKFTLLSVEKNV